MCDLWFVTKIARHYLVLERHVRIRLYLRQCVAKRIRFLYFSNSIPETNLLSFQNCNIILNLPSQSNNSFFYSFQEQLSFSSQLLSDARLPHLCVAKCPKIRHVPQSREGRKFRIISGMWLLSVVRKLYLMPEGLWRSRRLLFHQSAVCWTGYKYHTVLQ